MDRRLGVKRRTDRVRRAAHLQGVEAERAEDLPRGHLTVVLVAGVALTDVAADEGARQALPHRGRGLRRLPCVVVHVGDVVGGLVAQAPLPHPNGLRLAHLVDDAAVGPGQACGLGSAEELVELGAEPRLAAVEVRQSLAVLHGVEGEVPPIGLGELVAPHPGVEVRRGLAPRSGGVLALEETRRRVEQLDVVLRPAEVVGVVVAVLLMARVTGFRGVVELLRHRRDAVVVQVVLQ